MELTKDKYSNTCDDCGRRYTNEGYIIKSEKNQIRIHLCPECLKKVLNGKVNYGYNLKKTPSKLIKDYNVSISLTNSSGVREALSNIAFAFNENYRIKNRITQSGYAGAEEAVKKIIHNSKCSGEELAKNLNKSGLGLTNWRLYEENPREIVVFAQDKLGNRSILKILFNFGM